MVPPTEETCDTTPEKVTHRNPAAAVGSPVDLGTAVEVGSPAAGEDLAGMLPAVGRTGHYLQGATAHNVSGKYCSITAKQAGGHSMRIIFLCYYLRNQFSSENWYF